MKLHKFLLIIIFVSGFAYSQNGVMDHKIVRYEPGDTCWIMYAIPFDTHGKLFWFEFDFYCSQSFKDKYAPGVVFDYLVAYYKENYVRMIPGVKKKK